MESPSRRTANDLIFGSGGTDVQLGRDDSEENDLFEDTTHETEPSTSQGIGNGNGNGEKRESAYVELFHKMLEVVMTHEDHLLSQDEFNVIGRYVDGISSDAQYLLIRLCLRKEDKWHRLSDLKYEKQIGGGDGIRKAIDDLCSLAASNQAQAPEVHQEPPQDVKQEEPEIIDLSIDEDNNAKEEEIPIPLPPSSSQPAEILAFAEDDSVMTIKDLLGCLNLDELKDIAKQFKVKMKGPPNRNSIVHALLQSSSTQSTLGDFVTRTRKPNPDGKPPPKLKMKQTTLPFTQKSQQARLRDVVMKKLGKCIRVNEDILAIFRRINLIYFRSTEYCPKILTPALLTRFKKRFYPTYTHSRRKDIWASREALIEFEEALALEAKLDSIDGYGSGAGLSRGRSVVSKTPARGFKTPGTPASIAKGKGKENVSLGVGADDPGSEEGPAVQKARLLKEIFEVAYPKWQEMVAVKGHEEGRAAGLERFDGAHVYTRMVCKSSSALGVLKEYEREVEVLDALLAQRRYRRGRRGRWHDRKALVLMHHLGKDNMENVERAYQATIDGLEDNDTHMVYRPSLAKRLTRLEKKLNIRDRHTCAGQLHKAEERTVEGLRIRDRGSSLHLDAAGRAMTPQQPVAESPMKWTPRSLGEGSARKLNVVEKSQAQKVQWTGKSIWRGRENEEVSVEILALQHYETLGYQGFHCEGRILCTIFGLLFWDILFADVPGAFETPYQSAPLDIAEESFYHAREELIERRLTEIMNGQARQIMEVVDDKYRENKTWGVGVRWDSFGKQDLLEITHCLGGTVLSAICRCFCERYSGGGVPDLIVWNMEMGHCMFVEVKGPGDTLQQNQRVWIDVLLRGQASVELCHVVEQGQVPQKRSARKAAPGSSKKGEGKGKAKRGSSESESEHENMAVESEDEEWNPNPDKDRIQDDPPIFEIKTRSRSASITRRTSDVSMDDIPSETDNEEDELDPTPSNSFANVPSHSPRGTKRKPDQLLESPTPKTVSRSSSSKSIVEVVIPLPSRKKRLKRSTGPA